MMGCIAVQIIGDVAESCSCRTVVVEQSVLLSKEQEAITRGQNLTLFSLSVYVSVAGLFLSLTVGSMPYAAGTTYWPSPVFGPVSFISTYAAWHCSSVSCQSQLGSVCASELD
jgi:hypothetical protein